MKNKIANQTDKAEARPTHQRETRLDPIPCHWEREGNMYTINAGTIDGEGTRIAYIAPQGFAVVEHEYAKSIVTALNEHKALDLALNKALDTVDKMKAEHTALRAVAASVGSLMEYHARRNHIGLTPEEIICLAEIRVRLAAVRGQ